jgi:hypothetical protein
MFVSLIPNVRPAKPTKQTRHANKKLAQSEEPKAAARSWRRFGLPMADLRG